MNAAYVVFEKFHFFEKQYMLGAYFEIIFRLKGPRWDNLFCPYFWQNLLKVSKKALIAESQERVDPSYRSTLAF